MKRLSHASFFYRETQNFLLTFNRKNITSLQFNKNVKKLLRYEKEQRSLTKEEKEAIGILSIGTFLEYFDLMLYVHMAVLLNELFFSPDNSFSDTLITSFAFCSTFIFRPVGALIFGWIGDSIGRKSTVIITAFLMAISCLIMANLSPYAKIGITASWLVTICRIIQGISSMGEIVGAELYLTETINPPIQYPAVALMSIFASVGSAVALGIASLVTSFDFNWRMAFWFGAGVALIGTTARTALRETPEFADAKRYMKKTLEKLNVDEKILQNNLIWNKKVNKKTILSFFLIQCIWPVCFYVAYIYCGNILKTSFGYIICYSLGL
ncbi:MULTISPECIES: MFS transporter [unclassified Rickettsia]|uniref:MFS transporter n=1 Tax=unclassified Rickettsia TaxID=114295 RepID=UPI003132BCAA